MNDYFCNSITELQRRLVRAASTGHVHFVCGEVAEDRYEGMSEKFKELYAVDRNAALRVYHRKQHGAPSVHFCAWKRTADGRVCWWLLATDPRLFKSNNERQIQCLKSGGETLTIDGRYALKRTAKPKRKNPKTGQKEGGGESVTFYLTKQYFEVHKVNITHLASAHGQPRERVDDLRREVESLLSFPMWRGVREQVQRLLAAGVNQWEKTHRSAFPVALPDSLPYLTPVKKKSTLDCIKELAQVG